MSAHAAYAELLARLVPARRFGVVLGLDRMRALLDRLGAPDRRLGAVVHVGGTNGKGSTVAIVAALAAAGGARVAAYTSPHLSSLRERIVIDGAPITEEAVVAAAAEVEAAGGAALTFFEQVTAIAIVAIAHAQVDVTLLEVGLGGRLDATNVVAAPVAVVTGVALDHEGILGDTLALIAGEKAGIFKPGQRIVIGASGEPAAVPVLLAAAQAVGPAAVVTLVDEAAVAAVPPVALRGAHQRRNAAAALAALDHLTALGVVEVAAEVRARALSTVTHPGRYEVLAPVADRPRVILDGAHNPHGAAALAAALVADGERPTAILAVSADKQVPALLAPLAGVVDAVIATRYQQERALAPDDLAAIVRTVIPGIPVTTAPDLASAVAMARGQGRTVLIAGSLFLVGEARTLLLGAPTDPVRVSDPSRRGTAP